MSSILEMYAMANIEPNQQNSINRGSQNQLQGPPPGAGNGAEFMYQQHLQFLKHQQGAQKGTNVGLNDFQKIQDLMATLATTG